MRETKLAPMRANEAGKTWIRAHDTGQSRATATSKSTCGALVAQRVTALVQALLECTSAFQATSHVYTLLCFGLRLWCCQLFLAALEAYARRPILPVFSALHFARLATRFAAFPHYLSPVLSVALHPRSSPPPSQPPPALTHIYSTLLSHTLSLLCTRFIAFKVAFFASVCRSLLKP